MIVILALIGLALLILLVVACARAAATGDLQADYAALEAKHTAATEALTRATLRADLAVAQARAQRDARQAAEARADALQEQVERMGAANLMHRIDSRLLPSLNDPDDLWPMWAEDEAQPTPIFDALRRASVSFVVLPAPTLAEAVGGAE